MEEVFVLKARIKFRKYGVMKFIGHLDIMRFFQKVMRRGRYSDCVYRWIQPAYDHVLCQSARSWFDKRRKDLLILNSQSRLTLRRLLNG